MLKDLGKRIVTSSISILVLIALLVYADRIWGLYALTLVLALLSAVGSWEYLQLFKEKGGKARPVLSLALSVLVTLSFFPALPWHLLPAVMLLFGLLLFFAFHFRDVEGSIVDLSASAFSLIYIAVPLGMIFGILYGPAGALWIAYLLAVTKSADMGAYFAGSLFGKRKLASTISPSKTWEGAAFGLISSVVVSFLFYLLALFLAGPFHLGPLEWLVLGVALSVVGQFGDLCESLLKRDARKKDSNALPGLGGVLDAVDSLLLNIPLLYFYLAFKHL